MRYIVGIKNCEIVGMPIECMFTESEEDLEMTVFREGHNCDSDIGTKEYLINKYKGQIDIEDFED